ncbi:hypothetical protein D3C85_1681110 [compost metagenome]
MVELPQRKRLEVFLLHALQVGHVERRYLALLERLRAAAVLLASDHQAHASGVVFRLVPGFTPDVLVGKQLDSD